MCRPDSKQPADKKNEMRQRRGKRDKEPLVQQQSQQCKRRQSKALQRHKNDAARGGVEALLPSLVGVSILVMAALAKAGFRGRATTCGIDLGTTNSVVCVQAQSAELQIDCVVDPTTNSPVIPSVVSFLEVHERKVGPSSKTKSLLTPHPSYVVAGEAAKRRLDSHPRHTLYHAKRVLGREVTDPAVALLQSQVEFEISLTDDIHFRVPDIKIPISPGQVGSYVVDYLRQLTQAFVGHENVKSAIVCVPAKFTTAQRQATAEAFSHAGLSVARMLEEPTAAALAYGLQHKEDVDYILVYDFGGGTLDVSLLYVSEGFVDVLGSDGDDRLGGADFDVVVAQHWMQEESGIMERVQNAWRNLEKKVAGDLEDMLSSQCDRLRETPLCTVSSFHSLGELVKISLSKNDTASAVCLGLRKEQQEWTMESFCSALEEVTLSLSLSEYNQIARPLFDRAVAPVTRLLNDLDLKAADMDEIVMVGGTTRMPQIRELVQQAFPESQLNTHIDPDITVAYGAASVVD